MLNEVHAIFIGRVQGVGFRYTAEAFANELHLTGSVQNLSNGTVELFAQGKKEVLEDLIDRLLKAFEGKITDTQVSYKPCNINDCLKNFHVIM